MVIKMNEQMNNDVKEDNVINNKKTIFSPNKIVAIVIYILMIMVVAGVITIILGIMLGISRELDTQVIIQSFAVMDLTGFEEPYLRVNAIAQGWGNLLGYLIATAGVVFYMRDDVVTDFKDLIGENKKKYAISIPIYAICFLVITLVVDSLVSLIGVDQSANQQTIENILNNGGMVPMLFATIFLAPVVEEFIYRKAIFSLAKPYGNVTCYILSIALFTLPHMLSSDMSNIGMWLLQCIPYATAGGLLCYIYHKSNYNVYASIGAHLLNNLIACILVFI